MLPQVTQSPKTLLQTVASCLVPLHRSDSKRKISPEAESVTFDLIAEHVTTDSSNEGFIALLSEIEDLQDEFQEYKRRCCIANNIQVESFPHGALPPNPIK
jgi:hypothetical protein